MRHDPRHVEQERPACKRKDYQAAEHGKNRPIVVREQADSLIIQAIYRRFTGTAPSIYLVPRRREAPSRDEVARRAKAEGRATGESSASRPWFETRRCATL